MPFLNPRDVIVCVCTGTVPVVCVYRIVKKFIDQNESFLLVRYGTGTCTLPALHYGTVPYGTVIKTITRVMCHSFTNFRLGSDESVSIFFIYGTNTVQLYDTL